MNNEMRNGWIDIISKMYKDLHNSERVMHISKEYDKKRERLSSPLIKSSSANNYNK